MIAGLVHPGFHFSALSVADFILGEVSSFWNFCFKCLSSCNIGSLLLQCSHVDVKLPATEFYKSSSQY
jgi:hypothetical protein